MCTCRRQSCQRLSSKQIYRRQNHGELYFLTGQINKLGILSGPNGNAPWGLRRSCAHAMAQEGVIKEGPMQKLGGANKNKWEDRAFKLTAEQLSW